MSHFLQICQLISRMYLKAARTTSMWNKMVSGTDLRGIQFRIRRLLVGHTILET